MKKIIIAIIACLAVIVTACSTNDMEGNTWYRTRTFMSADSTNSSVNTISMVFTTDNEGTHIWELDSTFIGGAVGGTDSTVHYEKKNLFTYTYSNGTGIVTFNNGNVFEYNMRNDRLIMQGCIYYRK